MIPVDQWLGIVNHRFSPGVREMCCREALHCSFEVASENVQRMAQLSISGGTIRMLVENQGRSVVAAQRSGSLGPGFTAADCTAQTMITGTDGVMVPMVTDEQKRKRRQTEAAKRARQGRRSTARRGRPKTGSDGPYNELKVLSFYDPDKAHCHVVGTAGNHEVLGHLMRREAGRLQLGRAKVKYAVTDGAEWIANQYRRQLPMLDEHILDYYHLREHVVQTSHVLYGEGTKKAENWREDMMGCVWEQGSLVMLHRLGAYLRRHRGGPKREALESPGGLRGQAGDDDGLPGVPRVWIRLRLGPDRIAVWHADGPAERLGHAVGKRQRRIGHGPGRSLPQRPVAQLLEIPTRRRLRLPGFFLAHVFGNDREGRCQIQRPRVG